MNLGFMSKNKPQTIADLRINWTFSIYYEGIEETAASFIRQNPDLRNLKIKKDNYTFKFVDQGHTFVYRIKETDFKSKHNLFSLPFFFEQIDYTLRDVRQFKLHPIKSLVFDRFEEVNKNEFFIHVKN
jgi:hypothetical protein